jgi:hypothetical protein
MQAGTGEQRADGELSIGDIEMKLVAAPVLFVPLAAFLGADIALKRQLAQHAIQLLMALPLQPSAPIGGARLGGMMLFPW